MTHLPNILPIFPLDGALLLPRGNLPLNIFEPRYIDMINYALKHDRMIGMVQTDEACSKEHSIAPKRNGEPGLCKIGCAGKLTLFSETNDGRYVITLSGISRFEISQEVTEQEAFRLAQVNWTRFNEDQLPANDGLVDRSSLLSAFKDYLTAHNLDTDWESVERSDTESLVNALCMMSPYGVREKQALLEAKYLSERASILIAMTEMTLIKNTADDDLRLQ